MSNYYLNQPACFRRQYKRQTYMTTGFCNKSLAATAIGGNFNMSSLEESVFKSSQYPRYGDATQIQLEGGEAWVFSYGVVVFWGVSTSGRQDFLNSLYPHTVRPYENSEAENYQFELNAPHDLVHLDTISLSHDDALHRLAASHAFAQSVKLNALEAAAQATITDTAKIPHSLAQTGRFTLSRRQTAKIRGKLFSTKSDIILNYGLLDTPEFFWDYAELEPFYQLTARYLEITPRVELLSKKLETIHDLFQMLADEQNHRHSATLEWIIIILIALEIVLFTLQELFLSY